MADLEFGDRVPRPSWWKPTVQIPDDAVIVQPGTGSLYLEGKVLRTIIDRKPLPDKEMHESLFEETAVSPCGCGGHRTMIGSEERDLGSVEWVGWLCRKHANPRTQAENDLPDLESGMLMGTPEELIRSFSLEQLQEEIKRRQG